MLITYAGSGYQPDFEVRYQFLSLADGGREHPPHQRMRSDFLYEGDEPQTGTYMVWPEFIDEAGLIRPMDEVPMEGLARMFVVNPKMLPFHLERLQVGTRGFFMEGVRKVATCEVTRVLKLPVIETPA